MQPPICIDGIRPENISPTARIEGQSLLSGERTRIGPGAVIVNSYVHDTVIDEGAQVFDSTVCGGPGPWVEQLRSDFEARWAVCFPHLSRIGRGSRVESSMLTACGVGARAKVSRCSAWGSYIGDDNDLDFLQCDGSYLCAHVTAKGPTEIGAAWVGHHALIDQIGNHDAIYSNDLCVVEFDERSGGLTVKDVLDIPHVSRYGRNLICSLHSAFIGPQPGNRFDSFGRASDERWSDCLWYMGKVRFDPCCWVSPWTKVIGIQCQTVFRSYEDLLTKNTSAHVLPFSAAGKECTSVSGRTMPGELYDGDLYKQRTAAWVFTYAPDAVFAMVKRVHRIVGKELADGLVTLTLRNAAHFIAHTARSKGIRLDDAAQTAKGWGAWLARARATVRAHLDSGLWEMRDGEPVNWRRENGAWVPRKPELLLAIAPDALQRQCTEEELLASDKPLLERRMGVTQEELLPTTSASSISPESRVAAGAFIGPGVHISGASVVEEGAWLYRTVVKDSRVGRNVRIARSYLEKSEVTDSPDVNSVSLINTRLRAKVACKGSRALNSDLSEQCRLDAFADLDNTVIGRGAIIGGSARDVRATTSFFLVHMHGHAQHVRPVPTVIDVDGKQIELIALAPVGGGGRLYGTPEKPVFLEGCFLGSNSIIEAGVYVGLGCFVLDGLREGEGLLPFTLSKGPGAQNDQLATVLFQHPAMVISSIITPTFHGTDPANRPYVVHLITAKIREALAAIGWITALRQFGREWEEESPFAKYANLRWYSAAQLAAGRHGFEMALADGRWEMELVDGELRFKGNGRWIIDDGSARWRPGRS